MKFNSFDYIEPCLGDVKKLLLPIKAGTWFKLGFVSLLSGTSGGSLRVPRINMGRFWDASDDMGLNAEELIQRAKETVGSLLYLIIPIMILLLVIRLALTYISSVFSFVFIESLDTSQVKIKKYFSKNLGLGWSLFLFRIGYGIFMLAVIVLALLPAIIPVIRMGLAEYIESFSVVTVLSWIPSILLIVLITIISGIFLSLVGNFSIMHMYFTKRPIVRSIKDTFSKINKNKVEVFVFIAARIVIGIAIGIISIIVLVPLIIILIVAGIPFALMIVAIGSALSWSIPYIVAVVLLGLLVSVALLYLLAVLFLPLSTYSVYFAIRNYKALMK